MTNSERIYDYDFWNKKYSEKEIRDYIGKNPEKLDWIFWKEISTCQKLSEEFLIEHLEKIDFWRLQFNRNIPEDVKQRIYNLKKVIDQ